MKLNQEKIHPSSNNNSWVNKNTLTSTKINPKQPKSSNSLPIFTKLKVGQPNDKYEQEADRIADQVVNASSSNIQRKCSGCEKEEAIQRKPAFAKASADVPVQLQHYSSGIKQADSSLESQLSNSKSGGSPLPDETRSFMESRIGADFSNVKIHTDSNAVQMSEQLGAQAFTHGNHVYFNQGKYNPSSSEGKHLLAHELVHTVQQRQVHSIQSKKKKEKHTILYDNPKKRDRAYKFAKKLNLQPVKGKNKKTYWLKYWKSSKEDIYQSKEFLQKYMSDYEIQIGYSKPFETFYYQLYPKANIFKSYHQKIGLVNNYHYLKSFKSKAEVYKLKNKLLKSFNLSSIILNSKEVLKHSHMSDREFLNMLTPIYGLYVKRLTYQQTRDEVNRKAKSKYKSFYKLLFQLDVLPVPFEYNPTGKTVYYYRIKRILPSLNLLAMRNVIRYYKIVKKYANSYGMNASGIPYVMAMIFKESGGGNFEDKKLTIRFEPGTFYKYWVSEGKKESDFTRMLNNKPRQEKRYARILYNVRKRIFAKNFKLHKEYGKQKFYHNKKWIYIHSKKNGPSQLEVQDRERAALKLAIKITSNYDRRGYDKKTGKGSKGFIPKNIRNKFSFETKKAAYQSISMGVGQIMGFHFPNPKNTLRKLNKRTSNIDSKADNREIRLIFWRLKKRNSIARINSGNINKIIEAGKRYNGDIKYGIYITKKGPYFAYLINKMKTVVKIKKHLE